MVIDIGSVRGTPPVNTNGRLIHGFKTQLEEYQKAEKTKYAIYIVIDVGGLANRIDELKSIIEDSEKAEKRIPKVVFVNAKPKRPASKY